MKFLQFKLRFIRKKRTVWRACIALFVIIIILQINYIFLLEDDQSDQDVSQIQSHQESHQPRNNMNNKPVYLHLQTFIGKKYQDKSNIVDTFEEIQNKPNAKNGIQSSGPQNLSYCKTSCSLSNNTSMHHLKEEKIQGNSEAKSKIDLRRIHQGNNTVMKSKPANMVLFLCYQRVGSTYVADGLFNNHKDVIYFYEPIDAVYTILYGLAQGWAVPQDIFFSQNGWQRDIPLAELEAIVYHLTKLFRCEFQTMRTEYLLHQYWDKFRMSKAWSYQYCLKRSQVSLEECHMKIQQDCPSRFGMDPAKQERCRHFLAVARNEEHLNKGESLPHSFTLYTNCLRAARRILDNFGCVRYLERLCKRKTIRAIKTVRFSMDMAVHLQNALNNQVKVIHLTREPIAVLRSRSQQIWALHLYTSQERLHEQLFLKQMPSLDERLLALSQVDLETKKFQQVLRGSSNTLNALKAEASYYCSMVAQNLNSEERLLQDEHQNTTMHITLEQFVSDPVETIHKAYAFLGIAYTQEIRTWIASVNSTENVKLSKTTSNKWKTDVPRSVQLQIRRACQRYYSENN